jgi:glycosyltransferase involved in cell wall biosynthesis
MLLPCGVDVARVAHAATLSAHAPPGPPLIFVGRLIRHKRLDLLVRAVSLLAADRNPGPLLTLLGDGPERERLEALVTELGLAERVRFIRRVETSDEVYRELSRSRIAVQPSAREGFGLFPLEALAAGRPVVHVRSEESAVGELVREDIEGEGVAAEPESLAHALRALLADDARWERLSRNARLRAAQFDWARLADRFEERLFLGDREHRVSEPRGFDRRRTS